MGRTKQSKPGGRRRQLERQMLAAQAAGQQHHSRPPAQPPASRAERQPNKKQKLDITTASASSSSPPAASSKPQKPAAASSAQRKGAHNTYVPMTEDGKAIAFGQSDADSDDVAARLLQWLIAPLSTASFCANYFEKRPFAILRSHAAATRKVRLVTTRTTLPGILKAQLSSSTPATHGLDQVEEEVEVEVVATAPRSSSSAAAPASSHYYSGWLSKADVFSLLSSPVSPIHYTRDVDVTQYKDGKRLTLNPPDSPVATASSVRAFFQSGCSVRFLSPQQHSTPLWRLLHLLDSALGMQTGANSYLTPAGTQGFSPHYDDVDIIIMQTEGSKRWRLYEPASEQQILALHSSRNFTQDELGRCILDVWLHAGDFLYAPRGTIHQCVASEQEDSLHVTVSTCLQSSWADYLQRLLTAAVQMAREDDAAFRRVLPVGWQRYMGRQHAQSDDERREAFLDQAMQLLERMMTKDGDGELPFDDAADEQALDFMHARIRPCLLPAQTERTGPAAVATSSVRHIRPTTLVRLTQPDVLRLTADSAAEALRVHHIADNSRAYKAAPLGSIDLHPALAPAMETLLAAYPRWLQVQELPFDDAATEDDADEQKDDTTTPEQRAAEMVHLCEALCESGVLERSNDENVRMTATEEEEEKTDGAQQHETTPEASGNEDDEENGAV